jgi:hypothetical protein
VRCLAPGMTHFSTSVWEFKQPLSGLNPSERHAVRFGSVYQSAFTRGTRSRMFQKAGRWFARNAYLSQSDLAVLMMNEPDLRVLSEVRQPYTHPCLSPYDVILSKPTENSPFRRSKIPQP